MSDDSYIALQSGGAAEIKEKGSRFFGIVTPAVNRLQAETILAEHRKRYYDATHVCYAWRVRVGQEREERFSDDGEPSGTAGGPILTAIDRTGVVNLVVAVVRWYGGTKLGTGGLFRAYGESAALALEECVFETCVVRTSVRVRFAYPHAATVDRVAQEFDARRAESEYGEDVAIHFRVPASRAQAFRAVLVDRTSGQASIVE